MGASPHLLLLPGAVVREPSVIAIGNFDGVHLGHRALLAVAHALAGELSAAPYALTFDPHPAVVLGGKELCLLTPLDERAMLVVECGLAGLIVQPFDDAFAHLSPEAFVAELLQNRLGAKGIVVGTDFRFGHQRAGDGALLTALGEARGMRVHCVPLVTDQMGPVASRRIRQALSQGNVRAAAALLGRNYTLTGTVERGLQRGRTLGFPTANISPVGRQLPAYGVYAAYVECNVLGSGCWPCVVNIGERPTMNDGRGVTVEAHVFDRSEVMYGEQLRLTFVERLRGEQKFSGLAALTTAISGDCASARVHLRAGGA